MHFSKLITLAFVACVTATPSGLNFNVRRTDGGDDEAPQTCTEALQQIPKCALSCITQPPIDAGCKSAADFACTCEKKTQKQITKAETPCVLKACGLKEALAASKAGKAVCEACNTSPSDPSDGHGDDGDDDSYEKSDDSE
ncbi:putative effector protein ec2 [Golovinomyces cichoracearum]|uniref:Putative effector protein ec2 n=1 Tax=Golovinomyces cichoracearum TaxID=62708 RepID=A0A420IT82_9PEZI|nr:putative effector protein ec2 [Golovinomyces cichoracearum]